MILNFFQKSVNECLEILIIIIVIKYRPCIQLHLCIDVSRPLTNDLWVFLFQTIDAECAKGASLDGTYTFVKAFIINVNKCLKPFFLEQHIGIVNRVTLQSFW